MPKQGQKIKKSTHFERVDWFTVFDNRVHNRNASALYTKFKLGEEVQSRSELVKETFKEMQAAGLFAKTTYWIDCRESVIRAARQAVLINKIKNEP